MVKDRKLGEVNIDWTECLRNPGEVMSQRAFLLPCPSGGNWFSKIYAKIVWIQESQTGVKDSSAQAQKDIQKGVLKFGLIRGKNLGSNKDVDPYAIAVFDAVNKFEVESNKKNNTQNPQWGNYYEREISWYRDAPKPSLSISIKDSNILKDDLLGKVVVDLAPAIDNPCKWQINDYYNLKDSKTSSVYVQAYFVPHGAQDPNIKPVDREGLIISQSSDEVVKGILKLKVIHARELKAADRGSSDPYCSITFPDGKVVETEVRSNTLNPIWNHLISRSIEVPVEVE